MIISAARSLSSQLIARFRTLVIFRLMLLPHPPRLLASLPVL
jgi:hypothetical protein